MAKAEEGKQPADVKTEERRADEARRQQEEEELLEEAWEILSSPLRRIEYRIAMRPTVMRFLTPAPLSLSAEEEKEV